MSGGETGRRRRAASSPLPISGASGPNGEGAVRAPTVAASRPRQCRGVADGRGPTRQVRPSGRHPRAFHLIDPLELLRTPPPPPPSAQARDSAPSLQLTLSTRIATPHLDRAPPPPPPSAYPYSQSERCIQRHRPDREPRWRLSGTSISAMASAPSPSGPITKVLLVGANGTVGSVILEGLVQARCFDVSVLRRSTSTSPPTDAAVRTVSVSPDLPLDELTAACEGQDAVVAAFPLKDVSQHLRLVEAAFRAGVRRFIPADYGSCDAASPQPQHHLKLYRDKTLVRDKCETLGEHAARDGKPFTWTSIICGHFFDYGLEGGLLHFNLDTHKAQILDGGDIKASASTLRRVAESVVAVLQRLDVTRNRAVYVQSFCPTQLEVLAALERATGTAWHTQHLDSNAYLERQSKLLAEGDHEATEEIVFVLGTVDADWTTRDGFAMELLGLQDEKLDDVVAAVVAKHKAK